MGHLKKSPLPLVQVSFFANYRLEVISGPVWPLARQGYEFEALLGAIIIIML